MFTTISETFSILFGSTATTVTASHVQYGVAISAIVSYLLGVKVGQGNPTGNVFGFQSYLTQSEFKV